MPDRASSTSAIVTAIRQVVGASEEPVQLHTPTFAGNEWAYVKECLDTGWVSSVGKFVDRFEADVASRAGTAFAVATSNGTSALQVALYISGVHPGDEVLIPTLTFVATGNAIVHCGAVPHFIDSAIDTLGVDPQRLAAHLEDVGEVRDGQLVNRLTGRPIRAVLPVHIFGHPVDMGPLLEVANRYGLAVIEDATEALGSTYHGRPCGSLARLGVFSFNGNKIITTGGGGAIVTDDEALAGRAKRLTTTAKLPHRWAFLHDEVAWNYRLPNLNAALGVAQLEQLDGFLGAKRRLAELYGGAFAGIEGAAIVGDAPGSVSNFWLNALLLDDDSGQARDALLEATHAEGLLTRPAWEPLHRLPMFDACPKADLSTAESLAGRIVNLPSSPHLAPATIA